LLICLSTQLCLFSQLDTPSKQVINGQVVVVISPDQLDSINVTGVALDGCEAINDTLRKEIKQYEAYVESYKKLMVKQDENFMLQRRVIQEQNIQLDIFDDLDKKKNKRITWLKIQRNTLACGLVAAIIKIVFVR